jgi:hypothetical protein
MNDRGGDMNLQDTAGKYPEAAVIVEMARTG